MILLHECKMTRKRGKSVGKQVRHKLTVDREMAEISLCCYARNRNDTVSREIRPHFCPSYDDAGHGHQMARIPSRCPIDTGSRVSGCDYITREGQGPLCTHRANTFQNV